MGEHLSVGTVSGLDLGSRGLGHSSQFALQSWPGPGPSPLFCWLIDGVPLGLLFYVSLLLPLCLLVSFVHVPLHFCLSLLTDHRDIFRCFPCA